MNLKLLSLLVLLSATWSILAQNSLNFQFEDGSLKGIAQSQNGMFHGEFKSYYKNGELKASGEFYQNQRIGNWCVYDSLGNIELKRNFKNNRCFTQKEQGGSQNEGHDLSDNDSTYITLEKNIPFAKTIFLDMSKIDKPFRKKLIKVAKEKGYRNERLYNELSDTLDWKSLTKNLGIVVQFNWIFDSGRNMVHLRMFAFGLYESSRKKISPYSWVWYQDMRKECQSDRLKRTIDNIHELRIPFDCVRIENPHDNQEFRLDLKHQEILFNLFDYEHDLWMENKKL